MDVLKIDCEGALRDAIRRFARAGSKHDGDRRAVATVAGTLNLRGLVPDNWSADGTLRDVSGAWVSPEQRETWNDLYVGLSGALDDAFEDYWIWVQDFTATDVIFSMGGDLYSASYSVQDGGPITIGDPVKVRPVTAYVETETNDANAERLEVRSLEWRRAKVATMEKAVEHRNLSTPDLEIRTNDTGGLLLTGYASVYEVDYDMGWYQERVAAGAGKRSLGESPDVQLLLNHTSLPLARTVSGTLRLSETPRGLYVEADLDPEDPDVQSLVRKNRRGDLTQMSFAFRCTDDAWNDDFTHRTIRSYSVHRGDVSVVNMGANPATDASIRSGDALRGVISVLEQRAGKTLSAATTEILTRVLGLVANADEAVDEAQPLLADLLGVPDPDDDSAESDVARAAVTTRPLLVPDHTLAARQRLAALRRAA